MIIFYHTTPPIILCDIILELVIKNWNLRSIRIMCSSFTGVDLTSLGFVDSLTLANERRRISDDGMNEGDMQGDDMEMSDVEEGEDKVDAAYGEFDSDWEHLIKSLPNSASNNSVASKHRSGVRRGDKVCDALDVTNVMIVPTKQYDGPSSSAATVAPTMKSVATRKKQGTPSAA